MATPRPDGVFVSSVYNELKEYRKAALDAIWRSYLYPVGMEREDIAKPETKSESSFKMIDESSVYIGIFAFRYGVVTVEELDYAQKKPGIPILIFLAENPLNDDDTESDPVRAQKLKALKDELQQQYVTATFQTPEGLGAKVLRSLVALREEGKLTPKEAVTSPHRRITEGETLPQPPAPFYVHPYVAGGAGFIGRRAELAFLDDWAGSAEPMLIVDAIGGAGKSALAWAWTHTRLNQAFPRRAGLLWWSFYESNATMSGFLAWMLAYLTGRPLDDCARLPRDIQETELLAILTERRVLLVLDGVERLLLAYHKLDAPHLTDEQVREAPRACIDPRDGTLLRKLTRATSTKILLTTRLIPQDLQDRTGQLLQGVRLLELPGLSADDAITLFTAAGVHGNHETMRTFLAQFGYHALLTRALAGRISAFRPAPGNFDAWYQAVRQTLRLDASDLTARQSSILEAALADLDPLVFRLLCQLAAFRYPVDYEAVVTLNPFRVAGDDREEGLTPLHAALTILEERGLLQWDRQANRYDLHPVVRAYAYARLEDKATTFAQMKNYFEALPAEDRDKVQDVADLRRTLELYHALLNAGQPDEALDLYYDRLSTPLLYILGAYTTIVEILTPLFRDGLDRAPIVPKQSDQGYSAAVLAQAFDFLGEHAQAQALYIVGLGHALQRRNAPNVATILQSLGGNSAEIGQMAVAEREQRLALEVAEAAHEQLQIDEGCEYLINLSAQIGAWSQGERAYAVLQTSPDVEGKSAPFTFIVAARLRWGQGRDPLLLLEQALAYVRSDRYARAEREAQRLLGEVAFSQGELAQAEEAFLAAYTIAQHQGIPLGRYLADLARLRAQQGNGSLARDLITEALALGGLGVELAAVEVYLALGEPAEAHRHIEAAYREAWADGPPYAFVYELGRAHTALKALDMPEPQLPLFDVSRIPPLPYEAEIRAFIAELEREHQAEEDETNTTVEDSASPTLLPAGSEQLKLGAPKHPKLPWWKRWRRT
ncbi:MAG TPA: DUF4062 domain-containing protein [Ktedonobacterales bacterium]